jgi:hypothetical protein
MLVHNKTRGGFHMVRKQLMCPWHIDAYEELTSGEEIFYCEPYIDVYTGQEVMTVSKVLTDDYGHPFGVPAFDYLPVEIHIDINDELGKWHVWLSSVITDNMI